ncbi:DUF3426 domain-containing protein [Pseudomonas sp. BGr12]|uniref:DUF3426 domain-containing protein n=1 Tax=unclassified Pseudomonas TaxID=196821 RepID=UPI0017834494|nr:MULTISPECIES: DUF3426 domain-containing protein [unclassified Pseudomonas]MBD9501363.1 DUF3426 domain-containing protein [Pseudomonas sp. PDM17]MBD9576334.1 DUF3426 domain-containing protein [Pseudomonas sp. PDM23]MBD9670261.1 DUF3426 domain-containing protein [Pseudomonas sp. PDM21]MDL2430274.1 DUF3426 domain-containing protein [Pseudomonas sp. BJa5]
MSESFITQCPHCQTRFRVNSAQLGAASGAVRCGTCLKVFSAPQNMVGEPTQVPAPAVAAIPTAAAPKAAPAPEPAAPPAPPKAPEPIAAAPAPAPAFDTFTPEKPAAPSAPGTATLGWPLAPHAARHSSDVAEKPAVAEPKVEAKPAPVAEPAPAVAATMVIAPAATVTSEPPKLAPAPAAGKKDETLWIHDDLDLDSLNLDEELAKLDEFELSQEFLSIDRAPRPSEALQTRQEEKRDPHDERWAEALIEEEQNGTSRTSRQEPSFGRLPVEEPEEPPAKARLVADKESEPEEPEEEPEHEPRIDPPPLRAESDDEKLPAFSARRDDDEPDDEDEEPPLADQRGDSRRADPGLGNGGLNDLSDEPLQLDWQKPKSRWGRRLFWLLLVLLALAGLAGQYIAYHFDELARQDQYRPWFAQACPELGCTLPSKVDVEQIRSSNLVVRSHPDFSGALVVDAIIYNRANFSQPFPLLEMRFADLNGQLIASRRFKPSEYLSGELAGQSEMPPQTPIHISLDILDPGPKAVNYSLSFHSPE